MAPAAGRESGGRKDREVRRLRHFLPDRRAGAARRRLPDAFNPDQWMEPKEQRRVDDFIVFAHVRRDARRSRTPAGRPRPSEEEIDDRRDDRLRHRRPRTASPTPPITLHERGPRRHLAVLHSRPPDQSGLGLRLDPLRPQGAQPRGGDRLLDRRACDRRRGAADRARRRRRHGGRRRRSRRSCRLALAGFCACRALSTDFNDEPDAGLAALGQGPRRLRDGRGRRRPGARGTRARQGARRARSMPRSSATACRATPITSPRPPPDGDGAFRCDEHAR